jgi:hypothetical protein
MRNRCETTDSTVREVIKKDAILHTTLLKNFPLYIFLSFQDIFFYNFGWKDYREASMTNILDMVKVLSFALSEGKASQITCVRARVCACVDGWGQEVRPPEDTWLD